MALARVYKNAQVRETDDGKFGVWLDRSQLKSRGGKPLSLANRNHAELVASEWAEQGDHIRPETMPVTRLLNVAIDQTAQRRVQIIEEITRYGETDLILYRAPKPQDLNERQVRAWDPVLEWAQERGIHLKPTTSLTAVTQDAEALDCLANYADKMPDIELTLFGHFTSIFGSALLALATMQGYLSADKAFDLSRIDETYQAEFWGEDAEAASAAQALKEETGKLAKLLA